MSARGRRRRPAPLPALPLLLLAPLLLAACGYRRGLETPPGTRTVAVTYFLNDTPVRDLERAFAVELATAVRDLVQAPLVEPGDADVVIAGRMDEYRRRGGIRGLDNRLLESGVQIRVEAWLADGESGRRLTPPIAAVTSVGYLIPEQGGEDEARARALRHLADRIVLDLFQPAAPPRDPR